MAYKFVNNHVEIDTPKKRIRKVTGTRLAGILGLNNWNSPFQMWCEITNTFNRPFEGSIYTEAGIVIEPKIIDYLRTKLTTGKIVDGEEYWGKEFSQRRFDYYKENEIFGGMWDALILSNKTGNPLGVIEIKTTKRAEDWADGVPIYYKIQAMLYARLLKVKNIVFAVAFLDDMVYNDPSSFIANDETVKIISFRLDEDYIDEAMRQALEWHEKYVMGNVSPEFDERKDKEYLDGLRTNLVEEPDQDIQELLAILDVEKPKLEEMKETEKVVKKIEEAIKAYMTLQFPKESDTTAVLTSGKYEIKVTRKVDTKDVFDMESFKNDNPELYESYLKKEPTESIRQSVKRLKGEN